MENAYGLAGSLVQFKKKLIFDPCVIKVHNKANTYVIHVEASQSKVKSAIGFLKHLNPSEIHQFGGKKLKDKD